MKLSDFKNSDFKQMSEITLTEWVINGDHCPMVKIFLNERTNEVFQLSEKHSKYRQTSGKSGTFQYGEWKDLKS